MNKIKKILGYIKSVVDLFNYVMDIVFLCMRMFILALIMKQLLDVGYEIGNGILVVFSLYVWYPIVHKWFMEFYYLMMCRGDEE